MEFQRVKDIIKNGLTDAYIEVEDMTGTRDHLDILIISNEFKGKRLLQQHRLVMDLLREGLQTEIHAVQLKTMSYEDAEKNGIKIKN
jgi:stress-induced morphogen